MPARPVIQPRDAGQQLAVLGDTVTIKVHGRDTGGAFSQITTEGDPGSGPPLHMHQREDEIFYVIEGELEVTVAGETRRVTAGTVAFLPRGVPHTFKYAGRGPGKVLVTIIPAGFECFFEEVGALSAAEQQNLPALRALGRKYGLDFLPPP
jgi:quercetin dioxygenase-like cupin family protein